MTSISLELQEFEFKAGENNTLEPLVIYPKTSLKDIALMVKWGKEQTITELNLIATFYNSKNEGIPVSFRQLNFPVPSSELFVGNLFAAKYPDFMCAYIRFDLLHRTPIKMNIAAYAFEDEKERMAALAHAGNSFYSDEI